MVIKEVARHALEQPDIHRVCQTKDYIVTDRLKGIDVFDKNLNFVKSITLDLQFIISDFFTAFNANVVASWSDDGDELWIIDLETDKKQKIDLASSGYVEGTGLSDCYFWPNEFCVILDFDGNTYQINQISGEVKRLHYEELSRLYPEFSAYISAAAGYQVKNYVPQEAQFTYSDREHSEIGFVDSKNKITHTAPYISDDIHEIYFVANRFIVTHCNAIVSIDTQGNQEQLLTPQPAHEYRGSILMPHNNTMVILERSWVKSEKKMFLCLLSIS